MHVDEFNYCLPKELIAQQPLHTRDTSRLMVLDRQTCSIKHTFFHQLPTYLNKGDLLVANDTRVIPARLYGKKETGGWVEVFLLNFLEHGNEGSQVWECLLRSRRKIENFSKIIFSPQLSAEILEETTERTWKIRLCCRGDLDRAIQEHGRTPLPPYIKRDRSSACETADREHYQTVYARMDGAVAAPTAGLHFTQPLMKKLSDGGAHFAFLTLHVGYGTFQPICDENIKKHTMHSEYFCVSQHTAQLINDTRSRGARIIAVGTTATRALETVSAGDGSIKTAEGYTDLFIYPGYCFKAIDALITNFHLPMSSLLILTAAFAGKDFILAAYNEAVKQKYRFFSYGDAMLIV